MNTNRRTILHQVALGRITPIEAERLLIAWNDGRENLWRSLPVYSSRSRSNSGRTSGCLSSGLRCGPHCRYSTISWEEFYERASSSNSGYAGCGKDQRG